MLDLAPLVCRVVQSHVSLGEQPCGVVNIMANSTSSDSSLETTAVRKTKIRRSAYFETTTSTANAIE